MREIDLEKWLATIPHIVALLPLPFINILLVQLYRMMFGQYHFVDHHARENINFQISIQLYIIILFVIGFVIDKVMDIIPTNMITTPLALLDITSGIIIVAFLIVISISYLGIMVAAIIAALRKKYFKFPLTIRFVKS